MALAALRKDLKGAKLLLEKRMGRSPRQAKVWQLMFHDVSRSRPKGVRAATGISVSAWKEKARVHWLHLIRVHLHATPSATPSAHFLFQCISVASCTKCPS